MIALDTNVLVRLLMNDDKRQTAASLRTLEREQDVLLLNTVLLETVWVLQSVYAAGRAEILDAARRILSVATPESPTVSRALEWFGDGMDFADALHLATASSTRCETLYSFDKGFAKAARGKSACAVAKPA